MMATNNRIMRVKKFQLFGYANYIIDYNCAKFHVLASLVFELARGGVQNDLSTLSPLCFKKHLIPLWLIASLATAHSSCT